MKPSIIGITAMFAAAVCALALPEARAPYEQPARRLEIVVAHSAAAGARVDDASVARVDRDVARSPPLGSKEQEVANPE